MSDTLVEMLEILVERKTLGAPDAAFAAHRHYAIPLAVFKALSPLTMPTDNEYQEICGEEGDEGQGNQGG